jgi:nucleotide-binding universal stress UspA family protein
MNVKTKTPAQTGPNQDRHLLIAVDESENATHAVLYVADFLAGFPGFRVTLVNIVSEPMDESFAGPGERSQWIEAKRNTALEVLGNYRRLLVSSGFAEEKISVLVVVNDRPSIAECIIETQKKLNCCTVVMGRRGISRREEFIFGSTSSKILHSEKNCAVWVIE